MYFRRPGRPINSHLSWTLSERRPIGLPLSLSVGSGPITCNLCAAVSECAAGRVGIGGRGVEIARARARHRDRIIIALYGLDISNLLNVRLSEWCIRRNTRLGRSHLINSIKPSRIITCDCSGLQSAFRLQLLV